MAFAPLNLKRIELNGLEKTAPYSCKKWSNGLDKKKYFPMSRSSRNAKPMSTDQGSKLFVTGLTQLVMGYSGNSARGVESDVTDVKLGSTGLTRMWTFVWSADQEKPTPFLVP